ncbi:MAG: DUF4347 domain-containing protein [Oligoflexia bacterium]|nr:DUF4347 domain-containing protein [Oligoflexia bacterium]
MVDFLNGKKERPELPDAELADELAAKIRSCGAAAACLAGHGIRLSYSPAFVIWDGFRSLGTMMVKSATAKNPTPEQVRKILIMPTEVVYRNAPHLIGYSALTAAGWNVPDLLRQSSTATIQDLDRALSEGEPEGGEPFREGELMAIVVPEGDQEIAKQPISYFTKQAERRKLQASGVVPLVVSSPEDFVEKLGALRQKGRIRELVVVAHGSPGSFNFKSGGAKDIVRPSSWLEQGGELNRASLERLRPSIERWPGDLFASDARINLVSCKVARGEKGEALVQELAGVLLRNGGTFVASSRSVDANPWATSRSRLASGSSDFGNAMSYHFGAVPYAFLTHGFALGIAAEALGGEYSQEPVRVIEVK